MRLQNSLLSVTMAVGRIQAQALNLIDRLTMIRANLMHQEKIFKWLAKPDTCFVNAVCV